jgi:hypothetical protein
LLYDRKAETGLRPYPELECDTMGLQLFRGIRFKAYWLPVVSMCLVSAALLMGREATVPYPQQSTGYPPSVYLRVFLACPSDKSCTRTERFQIDPVPNGWCILTVTNGDGRGTDEGRSYEVFLNGKKVVPMNHSRNAQTPVKVLRNNTLKVILSGEPSSKVFVMIAYDPRKSK